MRLSRMVQMSEVEIHGDGYNIMKPRDWRKDIPWGWRFNGRVENRNGLPIAHIAPWPIYLWRRLRGRDF